MFTGGLGCRWLLQGVHGRAQQKIEKALTVSASFAQDPGSGQFTKTHSFFLTLRARRSASSSLHRRYRPFWKKKKKKKMSLSLVPK